MNIAQLGQFRNEFGSLNGKFAFTKFIFQAFQMISSVSSATWSSLYILVSWFSSSCL